ncbi:hypothetical protein [Photobacterium leiognathi]|uniref:hypothetical protein n=1 Tax=Photobacterium leiognathi TaxID=553611 RepID=UPI00273915F5|nr:hypothetical protein [Photobacterium leiognathi]
MSVRDKVWLQFIESNHKNLNKVRDAFEQAIENGELSTEQKADDLTRLLHGICYTLYIQTNLSPNKTELQQKAEVYLNVLGCNCSCKYK